MSQGSNVAAQGLVAVMATPVGTELDLKGKSPLCRNLSLRVDAHGHLSIALYSSSQRQSYQMLAWANSKIPDCRLIETKIGWSLWLDSAAFDVSAAEARQIRAKFESLGLRVEQEAAA